MFRIMEIDHEYQQESYGWEHTEDLLFRARFHTRKEAEFWLLDYVVDTHMGYHYSDESHDLTIEAIKNKIDFERYRVVEIQEDPQLDVNRFSLAEIQKAYDEHVKEAMKRTKRMEEINRKQDEELYEDLRKRLGKDD